MRIFNSDMTKELNYDDLDLDIGYLKEDVLVIHKDEIKGQEEKGHFETIREYKNGGADLEWVVDQEYIEHIDAHDETENVYVYVEYTKEELENKREQENIERIQSEIETLKETLASTDYKTLKYIDGCFTEEEYEPIRREREYYRERIRELEKEL